MLGGEWEAWREDDGRRWGGREEASRRTSLLGNLVHVQLECHVEPLLNPFIAGPLSKLALDRLVDAVADEIGPAADRHGQLNDPLGCWGGEVKAGRVIVYEGEVD